MEMKGESDRGECYEALMLEREESHRRFLKIKKLEAENAKLRELLEAIVEDGSVASWWLKATKALLKDSPES